MRHCMVYMEFPWGRTNKRCETCQRIEAAILALELLVAEQPSLAAEGMAGAPEKAGPEEEKEGEEGEEADEAQEGEKEKEGGA